MLPTPIEEKLYGRAESKIGWVVASVATQQRTKEYWTATNVTAGMWKNRTNGKLTRKHRK